MAQRGSKPVMSVAGRSPSAEPRSPLLRIGVLLASDVRLYREVLYDRLKEYAGLRMLGATERMEETLEAVVSLHPDVLLIDLQMTQGRAICQVIHERHALLRIVAFAVTEDIREIVMCASSGFSAYVPRSASIDDIARAAFGATRGELYCSPLIAASLFQRAGASLKPSGVASSLKLTRREIEIADLVGQNLMNKEIAGKLNISTATVKNHVHNLLGKLGLNGRGGLLVPRGNDR